MVPVAGFCGGCLRDNFSANTEEQIIFKKRTLMEHPDESGRSVQVTVGRNKLSGEFVPVQVKNCGNIVKSD